MRVRTFLASCAVLSICAYPAYATTGFYVADFSDGHLLEYTASLVGNQEVLTGPVGHPTIALNITPPPSSLITEGITGTGNDLLTVVSDGTSGQIARYTPTGTFIGYVGGGSLTFNQIGNFVVTPNAADIYVASSGNSTLEEVNLATNTKVVSVSLNKVHDVGLILNPNGSVKNVIAEDLNGGIEEYSSSLTGATPLVPIGTNTSTDTVGSPGNMQGNNQYGYAIDASGNIWTFSDNRDANEGTLYEFSSTGIFLASYTPSAGEGFATDAFGLSFGPDGNLYSSDLGTLNGGPAGSSEVTEFAVQGLAGFGTNPTQAQINSLFSTYIEGDTTGAQNANTGLGAPKYANWQTDFAYGDDPGVPEPSGVVTSIAFAGILGMLVIASRRRLTRQNTAA